MVDIREEVRTAIREHQLLRRGERVLVAVSGGVDSMVLLDVLYALAPEENWKLVVGHVNHQLRGASSKADEKLVRMRAKQLKLPCAVVQANVRALAKRQRISIEMAAREARHNALAAMARRHRIERIALAHHQDDQVEHFFLRLLRGSGGDALGGMKWLSPSPSVTQVFLVRALLECSKKALLEYAAKMKLKFREDATNQCLDIQRNRVRHELLPLLRRYYQPGLARTVLRVMNIVGAEAELARSEAQRWMRVHGDGKPDKREFEELPVAVQRQIIQMQLVSKGIKPEYEIVERLRTQSEKAIEVNRENGGRLGALAGVNAAARRSHLSPIRLIRKGVAVETLEPLPDFRVGSRKLNLRTAGTVNWHGVKFSWHTKAILGVKPLKKKPGYEFFDADAIGAGAKLRHWRAGDRFQPIGMKRAAKLQDLFVNQKLDCGQRRRLVVGTTATGEIFWVEGLRISERFKLTDQTIRRLHWAWQRL